MAHVRDCGNAVSPGSQAIAACTMPAVHNHTAACTLAPRFPLPTPPTALLLCFSCLLLQSTVVAALLQPSPEALALADELLLLSSGRLVYQGPPELALPFFQARPRLPV